MKKENKSKKTFVSLLLAESKYDGSKSALAEKLGMSRQRFYMLENKASFIPEDAKKLASLLGISDFTLARIFLEYSKHNNN
jgi:transcriptional regulator with XRE-family HTH domain